MPDGGMSVIKDVAGIAGGLGSGAGAVASFFNKPKAPDVSAGMSDVVARANEESAAAKAEKARIDAEEAAKRRLRMSGNFGRRSLMTNGEEGYSSTLGGP